MSNDRAALIDVLTALIPESQVATAAVDSAAADRLGLNHTDLRCLGAILRSEHISASQLASHVGLTRGAMTTALDRLERAGYVHRTDDPDDRRGVRIEATPRAQKAIRAIWVPIQLEGFALLKRFDIAQIELLIRFFRQYVALQRKHAGRIRGRQKFRGRHA